MRKTILATVLAATALGAIGTPALAQSRVDQQRWQAAQQRYQVETDRFNAERDRYFSIRGNRGGGYGAGYDQPRGAGGYNDPYYTTDYDASRYYREGPGYQERVLANDDQVYRGSDSRYYCRRSDGTTGLIVGGAAGGVLGNVIDGGRKRTAGTLLGAAVGALAGRAVDQNQSQQIRCR